MDDEGTLLKAKNFIVNGLKRGRPKKNWKEATEKDIFLGKKKVMLKIMLYGNLAGKTSWVPGRLRCLSTLLKQMNNDDGHE